MNDSMSTGRRKQFFFVFVFILTGFTFYYFGNRDVEVETPRMRLFKSEETIFPKGYLVYTAGCRIPEMDPFEESLRKHLKPNFFPACDKIPPLVESNQTSIRIVGEALRHYNVSDFSELDCCFAEMRRGQLSPDWKANKDVDNTFELSTNCTPFNVSANIPFEFIKVDCQANGALVYQDFHAFIVPKSQSRESTRKPDDQEPEFSVLIVGADSLSRLNFHRTMPKTKNLLKYLGAIEFFGHNKIEDNTLPNLVAMLSGYVLDELSFCWPNKTAHFDDCPWIWKDFRSKNYVTAFAEDACWMGIFNYQKPGFREPPTDYYGRPYIYTGEKIIGNNNMKYAEFCIGHRYAPQVLFDYAYKFITNMTLTNKKFWGLFWESSLTHDFLIGPPQVDDIFYNFLDKLNNDNVLNDTIVFVVSDHGMRWGSIRMTYQGRMEEHLPFLFVLMPDWFKEKYSLAVKNLRRNTHLLTTPFDVYETMKDLLDLESLEPDILYSRALEVVQRRGFSLFLPGSTERTCESAGIKPTWCTCQREKVVSTSHSLVRRAAKMSLDHINGLLKVYKQCAPLQLKKIISAYVESEDDLIVPTNSNMSRSDYVVTFVTTPGLARFESVVRHRNDSSEMTVVGGISRINVYGSQSNCISDYRLKLYCFCIEKT